MNSPSPQASDDASSRLAAELRRRRRRLVTTLGLPSLAAYAGYLALLTWGQNALRTTVPGGLSVGWLIALVLLFLPWLVCVLFARGARRHLDSLRTEPVAATGQAVRR